MILSRPLSFAFLLALCACAATTDPASLLHSVAWVQTAAEREAVCSQVFVGATEAMRTFTVEQKVRARPYAVVVDIDETMLDNSAYQASLVRDGAGFSEPGWQRWCEQEQATAIPGAVDFAVACRARGVTVFYITNRWREVHEATRRNLQACGFPLDAGDGTSTLLMREPGTSTSKQARRDRVAADYDVVLLVGDDLGDFLEPAPSPVERRAQVRAHAADWGRRWFLVPNPMYGSWQRALVVGKETNETAERRSISPAR